MLHSHLVLTYLKQGKLFVKEQGEVPFGLLVWSTGLAPNPLIGSITELKKDNSMRRSVRFLESFHLQITELCAV